MALHVMDEANHCLGCKNPRCQQGCPIHTNIPEVIRLLKDNKLNEAGRMLFENNPLTTVCSLICNHENQCEGHCVRGIKGAPVHFSVIENYISSAYASQMTHGPAEPNGKRVAIIGSGPAGLTIAVILARYGYDVTIFESHDKIGGVLRYGIPEFRLPKSVLDDFEYRHLRLKDIKVRPNTDVGKALKVDDLFRDGYKAIFIGTGVWRPNTLKIKGESLGHVHYAINYLQTPMCTIWGTASSSSARATRPWMWRVPPYATAAAMCSASPSPKKSPPAITRPATPNWRAWISCTTKSRWRSPMRA